ncbi:PIG-L family deacetylase [Streptomyces sp. So13.3]|uniref:PIG-L deacetylase family protein n=1 Tax=unclassified Streptomyces TaxID=2593676 RepID=UPI001105EB00|nr:MULTISPECIES: PIG-L deacetylase family protein [unclassified Streptomyces]MCZ4102287.1 PIG-L family deacetylase [Streptomyces sp. H39-C1]QNA76387.1 PIG-L family deacetylase [Streptomyces sp. So13.3]
MDHPQVLHDHQIERALVITAHPDDVDFLASGTVAKWTASGIEVTYCVLTDGDAGGFDPAIQRADIPALRREEQRRAADIAGVKEVHFLGYTDGALEVTTSLRLDLSRVIRQVRPQRIVMHSPEINWPHLPDFHPDHRMAGEATLRAVYPDARNPFAHPDLIEEEGLEAWAVDEIWMIGAPHPNHWVDITGHLGTKMEALYAHTSQTAHIDDLENTIRGRLALQATAAGWPDGRLAEAFHVVTTL